MPELPPTTARKPIGPDEPDRTGAYSGSQPPFGFTSPDDIQPGAIIAGKYKLLEAIGEGGMGAVWMAQQIEPVRRDVALKLIRTGMDSRSIVARFEAERQALSMMDHPNIARVFDGGTTAAGRPFFVMELVKGVPITTFCDPGTSRPASGWSCSFPSAGPSSTHTRKGSFTATSSPPTFSFPSTMTKRCRR